MKPIQGSWGDSHLVAVKEVDVCRQRTIVSSALPSLHSVHRNILREDVLSPTERMSVGPSLRNYGELP